jgi:hypothetical protein
VHKESLSELYANLLASAMDIDTAKTAHPGFVKIIRNMSSDEAKVLEYIIRNEAAPVVNINRVFLKRTGQVIAHELVSTIGVDSGCEHEDLTASYLVNLKRLGLIEMPKDGHLSETDVYDRIFNDPSVMSALEKLNKGGEEYKGNIKKYYVRGTVFGKQFSNACVISRDKI